MLNSRLLLLVILFAGSLLATSLEFKDPFGKPGDVIGDPLYFDIRSAMVVFDPVSLTARIKTNYENRALGPFTVEGVELNIGDLLFEVNGVPQFGIPLIDHGGLSAGHLYLINDVTTGILNAQTVLGNPGSNYRPTALVWLNDVNGSLTDITDLSEAAPTIAVEKTGNGRSAPKYQIEIQTRYQPAYTDSFAGVNGLYFTSATCGNDILHGAVPEPGTVVLMGGGLVVLALLRRRFRRG